MIPPDPDFPNRPTHPDFYRLCRQAQTNDNLSEAGLPIEVIVGGFVDMASLAYVAESRAAAHLQLSGRPVTLDAVVMEAAAIVDGFILGAAYERERSE